MVCYVNWVVCVVVGGGNVGGVVLEGGFVKSGGGGRERLFRVWLDICVRSNG